MSSDKVNNRPQVIKVGLVDDQLLFRAGIISIFKNYENIEVIFEAANGKELFKQLKNHHPHLILLDIEMPEMNGIEATVKLNQEYPDIKIIILTTHAEEEFVFDLMTKGAHGFLPKDKSVDEVIDAIYSVVEKGKYYNDEVMDIMLKGSRGFIKNMEQSRLTSKETEIIKLLCRQKTNKEIAEVLGLSVRTIENHRTIILEKTNTKNVAGIVMYALKHKIISRLEMM